MISAEDMPAFDLSRFFDRIIDFIETARKETNVLVHCFAGVSRSATAVIAYLMKTNNWSYIKSY